LRRLFGFGRRQVCFVAGTPVVLADGSLKPIEDIQAGERVLCDHDPEADNGPEVCEVTRTFERTTNRLLDLAIDGPNGTITITTTPEHPFYVPAIQEWVSASELPSDVILRSSESSGTRFVSAKSTPLRARAAEVYNLEVAKAHNYFVSDAKVLVHNTCPLGRGSTGRTVAWNLKEQLAMEQATGDPKGS